MLLTGAIFACVALARGNGLCSDDWQPAKHLSKFCAQVHWKDQKVGKSVANQALTHALTMLLLAFDRAASFKTLGARWHATESRRFLRCPHPVSSRAESDQSRRALAMSAIALFTSLLSPSVVLSDEPKLASAYFTAGDARLLQPTFDDIQYLGVKSSEVGSLVSPDGTFPAIRVLYKAEKISFKRVLGAFWRACEPTNAEKQFGVVGPSIVWVTNDEEQRDAETSRKLLDASTRYESPTDKTIQPMYGGMPVKTEIRRLNSEWVPGPENDQGWYLKDKKAYEKLQKKSGRAKFLAKAYQPVTTTACKRQKERGTICGYVLFPCNNENGCTKVVNGAF
jgi:peptide methionine sulfoxide reductase MsrA